MAINVDVTYNGNTITTLSSVSSAPITYGGNTIATLSAAGTKTLTCQNKMMSTDVGVGSATLACAGKVMASNVVITATSAGLYLIDGTDLCTSVTGGWSGKALKYTYNNNVTARALTKSTSGSYTTLAQAQGSSGTYQGAYVTANRINLQGYTKLILKYDLTTAGTTSSSRLLRVCLFAAGTTSPTYQSTAAYNTQTSGTQAGQSLTDQTLELDISGNDSTYMVGIGMNQNNPKIGGTMYIHELYAE